jgi:hypothetical protein
MTDDVRLSSEEAAAAREKAADEAANVRYFSPGDFTVFEQDGAFMLTIPDDCSYLKFSAYRTYPLSLPEKYISLRSGLEEIGMIRDLKEFDKGTQQIIRELLARRYFVPTILRIISSKERYGGTVLNVETDRGPKTIIVKRLHEALSEASKGRYFITDVEGNRYGVAVEDTSIETIAWIEGRI